MKKAMIAFIMIVAGGSSNAPARPDDLSFFQSLSTKKTISASEDARRARLLNDATFLRSLKPVLNKTPITSQEALEQNAAIDLLREAVRSGDSDTAIEVLRSVVMDEAEDPELQAKSSAKEEKDGTLVPGAARDKAWINVTNTQDAMRLPSAVNLNH